MAGNYWLVKCEPHETSFDDLKKRPKSTGYWRGVRNYQARNFIRDGNGEGGIWLSFITQTATSPALPASSPSASLATRTRASSTRTTNTSTRNPSGDPRWFSFDVKWKQKLKTFVHLKDLKENPKLQEMRVVQRGQRLSIQPVTAKEWKVVCKMGGV